MAVIDADTHVIETEHTWDYLDPSEQQFRPIVVTPKGESGREYWYIDGKIRGLARQAVTAPDVRSLEQKLGRRMAAPQEAREGENVEVRLQHMDELGVDMQVLWPTLFLERVADRSEVEIAVSKSYNRWMAHIWQQGKGRLRWVCVLPLQTMSEALEQLHFAHDHGAVGVFMRGIENEHLLHDPYFFPLYEEVSALNMAIGVHAGNANPYVRELLAQRNSPGTFWAYRMSSIGAFHSLVMAGLPDRFPKLRMVFVEIASQWVPWTLKDLARRLPQQRGRELPENPMKAYRLYVACQSDDDVPYVLKYTGEDNMVMGTDYGHHDHAADLEGLRNLRTGGGISEGVYQKIVDANPKAAYGL
jgi:predicted TIM-barrel fold metal-dependent hydrolase